MLFSVIAPNGDLILRSWEGGTLHAMVEADDPIGAAFLGVGQPRWKYTLSGGFKSFGTWIYGVQVEGDKGERGMLIVIQHATMAEIQPNDEKVLH